MAWTRTFWIIANLDSEFPGWREKFMCEGGHPLWDIFDEMVKLNEHRTQDEIEHLGRSFFRDRPMYQEGVKFLCYSHWIDRNPSGYLLMHAGSASWGKTNKERKEIVRKAFAYASKHGYVEAHKYLDRFKRVDLYAR